MIIKNLNTKTNSYQYYIWEDHKLIIDEAFSGINRKQILRRNKEWKNIQPYFEENSISGRMIAVEKCVKIIYLFLNM